MTTLKQAYEKAEQKAANAWSTAVAMSNDRAWAIADKASWAAEEAYQAWMAFEEMTECQEAHTGAKQ